MEIKLSKSLQKKLEIASEIYGKEPNRFVADAVSFRLAMLLLPIDEQLTIAHRILQKTRDLIDGA